MSAILRGAGVLSEKLDQVLSPVSVSEATPKPTGVGGGTSQRGRGQKGQQPSLPPPPSDGSYRLNAGQEVPSSLAQKCAAAKVRELLLLLSVFKVTHSLQCYLKSRLSIRNQYCHLCLR